MERFQPATICRNPVPVAPRMDSVFGAVDSDLGAGTAALRLT